MITNEKMAELVVQTESILRTALRPGHIPINESTFLGSPVAATVLQRLIDDEYDFVTKNMQRRLEQAEAYVNEASRS